MSGREAFLNLIRDDILKLSLAELDFGIYRILRHRRAEIEQFLNVRLPELMQEALSGAVQSQQTALERRSRELREELEQSALNLRYDSAFSDEDARELRETFRDSPLGQEFVEILDQLQLAQAQAGLSQTEEDRLYNVLYTFFSRYYRDGDFITQQRRGHDARYFVPYSGDDVHLHWRSRGSHYVKTTEALSNYAYEENGRKVVFTIVEASEEQDNIKGKTRYFLPRSKEAQVDPNTNEFVVPFEFRAMTAAEMKRYGKAKKQDDGLDDFEVLDGATEQDRILSDALKSITIPTELTEEAFSKHLRRYARKNRTDYFVHPRLGGFLRAELDHYLKTEFLDTAGFTDGAVASDQITKLRALKTIGEGIIDLLDQIETFQAALFEKRRFVLRADYLIPIRLVSREHWGDILNSQEQTAAWRALFAIEGEITEETLSTHPTLVVDTQHFDECFKLRLLAAFEDIDGMTDGLLVHAENYGALRTLVPSFGRRIKAMYLDPPYNRGSDGFLYKDDFARHSTWLSMMDERLRVGREMLTEDGVVFISIDSNEFANLRALTDGIYSGGNHLGDLIWKNATDNNPTRIAIEHEYIVCYSADISKTPAEWKSRTSIAKDLLLEWYATLRASMSDNAAIQKELRSFIKDNAATIGELARYKFVDDDGPYAGSESVHNPHPGGYVYDIPHKVTGRPMRNPANGYRFPWKTMKEDFIDKDRLIYGPDENRIVKIKLNLRDYVSPLRSVILLDGRLGSYALKDLFGKDSDVFDNPKPVQLISRLMSFTTGKGDIVLDYFAGSGTTSQAIISLNREDGAQRKFVLVDFGAHLEQVVLPRVQKVMYAPEWKDGKPNGEPNFESGNNCPDWVDRSPRLVKVLRLESYEDSLNALELPAERTARMLGQMAIFGDDYLLKYLLPIETEGSSPLLNACALEHPFSYALRLHSNDGLKEIPVDLVETANLLLGLRVQRIRSLHDGDREYRIVEGLRESRCVLVVWRDVTGLDPAKEVDFLQQTFDLDRFEVIYTNADSALPRAQSIDPELKRLMLERDRGAA